MSVEGEDGATLVISAASAYEEPMTEAQLEQLVQLADVLTRVIGMDTDAACEFARVRGITPIVRLSGFA